MGPRLIPGSLQVVAPWVRAARPTAHAIIAMPVLLGEAMAFSLGAPWSWSQAAVAHGLAALSQAAALYFNDAADEVADRGNEGTFFSGGSRVVPEGLLSARQLRRGAWVTAGLVVVLAAVWGSVTARPSAPLLLFAMLVGAHLYSERPAQLSYRGGGAALQGLLLGLGMPAFGFVMQSGGLDALPWLSLTPAVMMLGAANVLTSLPDEVADAKVGKRTWAVRVGGRRAAGHAAGWTVTAAVMSLVLGVLPTALGVGALMAALVFGGAVLRQSDERWQSGGMMRSVMGGVGLQAGFILCWTVALLRGASG